MNTLNPCPIVGPENTLTECAQFIIDDTESPFILSEIMTVGKRYALSLWIKSEANGTVRVAESVLASSADWQKYSVILTAADKNLSIEFLTAGTYYVYHPKLEIGNMVTDWSPAPEDHEQLVSDTANQTNQFIKDQTDAVRDSCEAMVDDATKDLIPKSEFESYKEIVETRFKVETDGIDMEFYAVNDAIKGVNNELDDKFTELYKYITFDEHGITIGSGDSAITLQLDNSAGIIFRKNGKRFGLWDGTDFYTGNIVVRVEERAQLGNFAYVPRSDGSLSFLKVGD